MTDTGNPLEPDPARDARIRERAYHLWLADGEPHGRDLEYWERASELEAIAANPEAGLKPNPASLPGADPAMAGVIVEEAEIQQNLGEFPDRFSDQGDRQQTPAAVHAPARANVRPPERGRRQNG